MIRNSICCFAHAAGFHPVAAPVTPSRLSTNNPDLQGLVQGIEITDTLGPYTVPFWSDYDQDGDMDIFMASGPGGSPGPDFCYRNMLSETGTANLVRMTSRTIRYRPAGWSVLQLHRLRQRSGSRPYAHQLWRCVLSPLREQRRCVYGTPGVHESGQLLGE